MDCHGEELEVLKKEVYNALADDHFSFPLCLPLRVPIQSICKSDIYKGDLLQSGTVTVTHSFSHVLEQDQISMVF